MLFDLQPNEEDVLEPHTVNEAVAQLPTPTATCET